MTTPFLSVPIFYYPGAVSGLLYTYVANSTTPQVTYSDAAGAVPNTNPVVLDTTGAAIVRLGAGLAYDFVLKDQTGTVTLWTANNYVQPVGSGSFTQATIAALLYPQTTAEAAAPVTPVNLQYQPLDPRRYTTIANWASVYAVVSAPADTDWPFYRGDHAQHNTQTNAIAGYKTFDDSQLTGTIGWHCTAFGAQALQFNAGSVSAGGTNTAIGYAALQHNVDGSGNTAVGAEVLNTMTGVSSAHNNCFGYRGCTLMTSGTQNNTFGFVVLTNLLTGNNNHGFGESVLTTLTQGNGNQAFGYQASFSKKTGDFSHSFGYQALFNETSAPITGITLAASAVITVSTVSAANPFLVGCPIIVEGALGMTQINGVQGQVTAIGGASGAWTVTVNINSSGFSAWTSGGGISPLGNAAFGYQTGLNLNFSGGNTAMGWQALSAASPGINNTAMGWQAANALNSNIGGNLGQYNVAVGYWALLGGTSCQNMVAIGQQAGKNITTGSDNVTVGANSGLGVSTAGNNTWVGSNTGTNLNGANNTGCGFNAGTQGSAQTFTNTQSFGANAVPTASNQVTLGDNTIATLRCQQTTITALSDARFKQDIATLDIPDAFLEEVRIVSYRWLGEELPTGTHVGVIAQELDALQEKYSLQWLGLVDKSNPDKWEATPGKLLFPLIQRVQRQEQRLKAIEAKLGL